MDIFFSPLQIAFPIPVSNRESPQWVVLREEATHVLWVAQEDADDLTRQAENRAEDLIEKAAQTEQEYRLHEQPTAAAAVLSLAQVQAEQILREAHEHTHGILAEARRRAEFLNRAADENLALNGPQSSHLQSTLRGLLVWPLRVLALVACLGVAFRCWATGSVAGNALLACLILGMSVALLQILTPAENNPVVFCTSPSDCVDPRRTVWKSTLGGTEDSRRTKTHLPEIWVRSCTPGASLDHDRRSSDCGLLAWCDRSSEGGATLPGRGRRGRP